MPKLIVLSGLPGVGKSAIARELARRTGAVWLRIDSMDRAIWASGEAPAGLRDWTYRVAQAVAEDNLRLGRDVIGDGVNGWAVTRDAWRGAGLRAGADVIEVEVLCSDLAEHRRRVETRASDIPGFIPPDWPAVTGRDYEPWPRERLVVDTAGRALADTVDFLMNLSALS